MGLSDDAVIGTSHFSATLFPMNSPSQPTNDNHDPYATETGAYLELLRARRHLMRLSTARLTSDQRNKRAAILARLEFSLTGLRPFL